MQVDAQINNQSNYCISKIDSNLGYKQAINLTIVYNVSNYLCIVVYFASQNAKLGDDVIKVRKGFRSQIDSCGVYCSWIFMYLMILYGRPLSWSFDL